MRRRLKSETKKLEKSWMQYDEAMLRDYLVETVEDPRFNLQSILSRHFLIEALFEDRFASLQREELRFAAAMNWLLHLKSFCAEDAQAVLYGLSQGADNVSGLAIPAFVSKTFAALPLTVGRLRVPNYIKNALNLVPPHPGQPILPDSITELFQSFWRRTLAPLRPKRLSVVEPACGSANDYRFLHAFGLARCLDYTGFDLCRKNVRNARRLFPAIAFKVGNAFEINAPDKAFEVCFVHDLFEHLSLEGLHAAIAEICRVTRRGICAHFFNMAEIDEHAIRPVDDYHWNTLSMPKVRGFFLRFASAVQVTHIGTFLRWEFQCPETYNPGAYTLVVDL